MTIAPRDIRHGHGGFSLIELLVTIVLAGIIFLAMVPLFVSSLKATSRNTRRVVATNIAQARIDTIKMLAANMAPSPDPYSTTATTGYSAITPANLISGTWNSTLLPTTYTPAAGGQAYNIVTSVSYSPSACPTPSCKTVTVSVSRPSDGFTTTATAVIQNPDAVTTSSTTGPHGGTGPFDLTVQFKNYTEVTSSSGGVTVVYVNTSPSPNVTTTVTPKALYPTGGATTVSWPSLPGGMNLLYTVTCKSTKFTSTSSPFHLLSAGSVIKFDTNPGGS